MKPYEQIVTSLHGIAYTIHHNDEPSYSFLEEGELSIEIPSPDDKDKITLDTEGIEYTLYFGNSHAHYYIDEPEELDALIECVKDIVDNKVLSAAIFFYEEDRQLHWLGSRFLDVDKSNGMPITELFRHVYEIKEFRDKIEHKGGEVHFRFWDASLNKVIILPVEK